jgi:hypothetical protein
LGPFPRADARTRTGDPFITSEVLYQLSYVGGAVIVDARRRGSKAALAAQRLPLPGDRALPADVAKRRAELAVDPRRYDPAALAAAAIEPAAHGVNLRTGPDD